MQHYCLAVASLIVMNLQPAAHHTFEPPSALTDTPRSAAEGERLPLLPPHPSTPHAHTRTLAGYDCGMGCKECGA